MFCPCLLLIDLSRTYTQDGVCLTESGLCQLQSLSAAASRRRKPKPKLKLKIINQNSVAVLQAPVDPLSEHSRDEDIEDTRGTCCLTQASSFTADCLLEILNSALLVSDHLHVYMDSFHFRWGRLKHLRCYSEVWGRFLFGLVHSDILDENAAVTLLSWTKPLNLDCKQSISLEMLIWWFWL